jgi:exodeoxyribonuclease VII small subunit
MKSEDPASTNDPDEPQSFEHSLAALEAIVHDLEDGQLGLAEALARYELGVKHLKHCYQLLQAAEQKIELLTRVADDGTYESQPLEESIEPLAESAGRRRRSRPVQPATDTPTSGASDIDG